MNPTSLPFEYPFQWDNESLREGAGVTPEGAAILKQRDRDLEDFLAGLGGGGGDYSATVTIAASDSSAKAQSLCDYVCDGTDDQEQFHSAFEDIVAQGGGRILLSEGTFQCSAGILAVAFYSRAAAQVTLQGQGMDSTVIASTFSTNDTVFTTEGNGVHVCDLTFDGSGVTGTTAYGVEMFGDDNSVRRVRLVDVGWQSSKFALYLASDNGSAVVEGCQIIRGTNGVGGLRLGGRDSFAVGNFFRDTPSVAIQCDSLERYVVSGNVIRDSQHDGAATDAIVLGDYSIASGNTAKGYLAPATISKGVGSVDADNVLA